MLISWRVLVNKHLKDLKATTTEIPKDWDQLALRFRLMHPSKLEMDHWDRVGSMGVPHGLFLEKSKRGKAW